MHDTKAVILDMGLTGYGIAKCLGHNGVPIWGVHNALWPPLADRSRYLERSFTLSSYGSKPAHIASDEEVVARLVEVGEEIGHRAVVYPASDYFVDLCSRHSSDLERHFHIPRSGKHDLHDIMYKGRMAEVAKESGLHVPESVAVTRGDSVRSILNGFPLPAIVKPGNSLQGYKEFMGIEHTHDALYRRVMDTLDSCQDIIVSQYIVGPGHNMREVLGFRSSRWGFIGLAIQKLRQHPYLALGSGTLEQAVDEQDIIRMTGSFADNIELNGVFHVEYKREEGTQRPYFIEANFRSNSGVCLSEGAGMNIPCLHYLDMTSGLDSRPREAAVGSRWVEEHRDWKLVESGQVTIDQLIGAYKDIKACSVFDSEDPEPFRAHTAANPFGIVTREQMISFIRGHGSTQR
jgi:predicted ATP-grasp superfamily ATP-dependent carboligase